MHCVLLSCVAVSIKPLIVVLENQQCFSLALLSSYKIFRTAYDFSVI
jgi:hypothetical protein